MKADRRPRSVLRVAAPPDRLGIAPRSVLRVAAPPGRLGIAIWLALAACGGKEGPAPAVEVAPPVVVQAPEKQAPPRPDFLTRVTIKALGMYCEESCPLKVRHALADVPSVYELGFDLSTESIFVSYDASLGPAKQVTRPMIAAIKRAGFDPWLGKESWPEGVKVSVVAR